MQLQVENFWIYRYFNGYDLFKFFFSPILSAFITGKSMKIDKLMMEERNVFVFITGDRR